MSVPPHRIALFAAAVESCLTTSMSVNVRNLTTIFFQLAYWISPALVRKVKKEQENTLPTDKKPGSPSAIYNHDRAVSTEPTNRV